jgi:hypothetical protein
MASVSEMSLQELPPGQPVVRSRLVAKVVEQLPQGEVFGARKLAAEVNRRFGKAMRKPANTQLVSAALRRMLANGEIRRVREGAGQQEALYARV